MERDYRLYTTPVSLIYLPRSIKLTASPFPSDNEAVVAVTVSLEKLYLCACSYPFLLIGHSGVQQHSRGCLSSHDSLGFQDMCMGNRR